MSGRCQHCQSPLPAETSHGVCPACLIALAKSPTNAGPSNRFSPASVEELAGRIPGVELISLIGSGGMGAVYRGHQVDLDREVAVKVLPHSLSDDPVFVERFRREAQTLAKLDHPNIVKVFGSGVADSLCYIVMEFVEGTTLRDAMVAKTINPAAALRIVPKLCEALAYAHGNGVVHRDIKPENILLGTGGRVKIVDFGLAKISDSDREATMLTATGVRLGTLRYMAPEQLDGMNVDHRADVYSLGVVFYEMLTGQVPMGQFAMPSQKAGTDPRIDDVVMRTLCRDPSGRYQHVTEIESELKSIADGTLAYGWNQEFVRHPKHLGWTRTGREWKSQAKLFGWPIVHIAYGVNPRTGKKLIAKGVIAIGDVAIGGLAMGGVSVGVLSFGGVALGINAMGGCAIGLQLAFGGCSIGSIAMGGAAIGLIAVGGGAVGLLAFGGGVVGHIVAGGSAAGKYVMQAPGKWTPPEFANSIFAQSLADPLMPWLATAAYAALLIGPLLFVLSLVGLGTIQSRLRGIVERPMPNEAKRHLVSSIIGCVVMILTIIVVTFVQLNTIGHLARPAGLVD